MGGKEDVLTWEYIGGQVVQMPNVRRHVKGEKYLIFIDFINGRSRQ